MKQLLKSFTSKRFYAILGLMVVVFGIGTIAWASGAEQLLDQEGKNMLLLTMLVNLMSWVWLLIAAVAAELMSNDLIYGQIVGLTTLFYQFWTFVRTVANILLALIIVFFIWQMLQSPDKAKQMLVKNIIKSVVAGILINISWFAIGALVDLSTIAITGVGQLTSQFMNSVGTDHAITTKQMMEAIPSKIKVTSKGCLTIEQHTANSQGWQNFVDRRNQFIGPLVFLGGAVVKMQAYSVADVCSDTIMTKGGIGGSITYDFKNITLRVIFTLLLGIMFVIPLVVLTAYNFFRLIYIWGWILLSPIFVLLNVFPDESKKIGLDGLQKMGSIKTLLTSLFQPMLVVGALGVGMMFVVGLHNALGYDKLGVLDVSTNSVQNGRSISEITIGGGEVGRVSLVDNIIDDPTGTIGGGFGYILITIAACMVLWMLVKLSFSVSKDNPGQALGFENFDPVKLMGDIRERIMKQVKLPDTGLGGPLDGASLQEATTLFNPASKDNRIMKQVEKVGNEYRDSGVKSANKGLENSSFGEFLGMQKNGDLSVDKLPVVPDDITHSEWGNKTKEAFGFFKTAASSTEKETFKIDRSDRKSYAALKNWYNDEKGGGKAVLKKLKIQEPTGEEGKFKDAAIPDFDKEFNAPSYVGGLIKYIYTTDKIAMEGNNESGWKLKGRDPSKNKIKLSDIDFKHL